MPKDKKQIVNNNNNKDYLYIAVGISISIFCVLLIGRVGKAGSLLALFFSFIFGDFSTVLISIIFIYTIRYILFKKKIDYHHISFIGMIFIFIAVSMFAHLGLYEPLNMSNKTILSKTLELYKNYLTIYEPSFSCGGGIISAIFVQISAFLLGQIGTILLGICFILIGISFFVNMNIFSFFRSGKLRTIPKKTLESIKKYIDNIHYPSPLVNKKSLRKPSISMLNDHEEQINFVLQNEINKEKFEDFKRYVKDNKIYCMLEEFKTSYSSSRYILKMGIKSEEDIKKVSTYFNRNCLIIKDNNEYFLDIPNQFRKLLTLKNFLLLEKLNNNFLPVMVDVSGNVISFDMRRGRLIVVFGDYTSGIKTFIRSILLTILIKQIEYSDIYFYDLGNDFAEINNSSIKYINNERSASIALDEAFSEYERRSEIFKYLNCDNIEEANMIIKKNHPEIGILKAEFHFLYMDLNNISTTLLQKITYAIRFTLRVGIHIIISCRNRNELSKLELNNSDIIAFSSADVTTSIKLFGSDIASKLQKKGDVIIETNGKIYHGQTPYVSIEDFNLIIKKI